MGIKSFPLKNALRINPRAFAAALLGWLVLGEFLPWPVLAGIGVAMLGILMVITEHSGSTLLPGLRIVLGSLVAFGGIALICLHDLIPTKVRRARPG